MYVVCPLALGFVCASFQVVGHPVMGGHGRWSVVVRGVWVLSLWVGGSSMVGMGVMWCGAWAAFRGRFSMSSGLLSSVYSVGRFWARADLRLSCVGLVVFGVGHAPFFPG